MRNLSLLSAFGVQRTAEGYAFDVGRWLWSGYWFLTPVIAIYMLLFLVSVVRFPLFSPIATVDEQLAYYTVARNFAQFGFLSTFFLHDMSTSSLLVHHPFIYNHMPPGPEVLVAVVLRFFGEQFGLVRVVLGLIFLLGLVFYVRFTRLVLGNMGLSGEGYALLLIGPGVLLHAIDHPAYSAFPFFAFSPVVALDAYYRRGQRRYLVAALGVVLLSSLYVTVHNFVIIAVSWICLCLLGLVRFDRRHLAAFLAVAGLGVALQFLRTAALLGPGVFFEDLSFTLSNRMFGVPSAEELMAFYRAHDLVLHGTHGLSARGLLRVFNDAWRIAGRLPIIVLSVGLVGWALLRVARLDDWRRFFIVPRGSETWLALAPIRHLFRMGVWLVAITAIPILLFPAYSADYHLQGLTQFFLAITAVAILAYAIRGLAAEGPNLSRYLASGAFWRLGAWVTVLLLLVLALEAATRDQLANGKQVVKTFAAGTAYASVVDLERHFRGRVVMSNVYPLTAGFFTREATFGGCEFAAFPPNGDVTPSGCHAAWIKGYGRTADVRPTHYILFRGLFTGFTSCLSDCLDRLRDHVSRRHEMVFENDLFSVFALRF